MVVSKRSSGWDLYGMSNRGSRGGPIRHRQGAVAVASPAAGCGREGLSVQKFGDNGRLISNCTNNYILSFSFWKKTTKKGMKSRMVMLPVLVEATKYLGNKQH